MNDVATVSMTETAPDLTRLTITEAAGLIAERKLSPVELVEAHLLRIDRLNGTLSAYITVLAERALARARLAEQEIAGGRRRGPLHGIPYGLKDNYDTAGIRTTAASRVLWDNIPNTDATLHARLEAAGAILLGKANTWEYGTGTGEVQTGLPFPTARNPWHPDYFAAGSSTGSGVAVAAGLAMFALGSDTGGSVRMPGATNGIVGHKPTYGRLSRAGILPNAFSLDVPGAFTRTARDNALIMQAIAGGDVRDPTSVDEPVPDYSAEAEKGMRGLRIGFVRAFHERDFRADPQVADSLERAAALLQSLGATIVDLDLDAAIMDCRLVVRVVGATESLAIHAEDFRQHRDRMSPALQQKFMGVLGVSGVEFVQATRWRRQLAERIDAAMRTCDAVICAGPLTRVPLAKDESATTAFMINSGACVFNVSGHPAASVCTGFDTDGLPLSMQIAGPYWHEATLLRVATAYEDAAGWHRRHPSCS